MGSACGAGPNKPEVVSEKEKAARLKYIRERQQAFLQGRESLGITTSSDNDQLTVNITPPTPVSNTTLKSTNRPKLLPSRWAQRDSFTKDTLRLDSGRKKGGSESSSGSVKSWSHVYGGPIIQTLNRSDDGDSHSNTSDNGSLPLSESNKKLSDEERRSRSPSPPAANLTPREDITNQWKETVHKKQSSKHTTSPRNSSEHSSTQHVEFIALADNQEHAPEKSSKEHGLHIERELQK